MYGSTHVRASFMIERGAVCQRGKGEGEIKRGIKEEVRC